MVDPRVPRLRLWAALLSVWLIWGSTYLAIRFMIDTLPGFLAAGLRFVVAGAILFVWAWLREGARPRGLHWRAATIVGGFLLLGGNGAVVWAEQRVPSGLAALIVAIVPLWIVLLEALAGAGRPSARMLGGVLLGLVGVGLLVGPGHFAGSQGVDLLGAAVLMLGSLSWALGSLYSRRAGLPESPLLATAMEMLCGGGLLLLLGAATGDFRQLQLAQVTTRSWLALGYLIVFGSLIGFTAYVWLLRVTAPAVATTYAYVNPVVAVVVGWGIAGEPITARTMLAMAIIVGAVVVITTHTLRRAPGVEARAGDRPPTTRGTAPAAELAEEPADVAREAR